MKYLSSVLILLLQCSYLGAEEASGDTPILPPLSLKDRTVLEFKEKRRSLSSPDTEPKKRVQDFNGNEAYPINSTPQTKQQSESEWGETHQPRPIYDIRRKEDVESAF